MNLVKKLKGGVSLRTFGICGLMALLYMYGPLLTLPHYYQLLLLLLLCLSSQRSNKCLTMKTNIYYGNVWFLGFQPNLLSFIR